MALSPRGGRVYATAGDALLVLDAASLRLLRRVPLGGAAGAVAVSVSGALAAVVLDRGRVAILDAGAGRLLRRVKVRGAAGVGFDGAGRARVAAPGRLYAIAPGAKKPARRPLKLGRGVGGAVAALGDGSRLAVGAVPGASVAAIVDARGVRRFPAGRGPGRRPSPPTAWASTSPTRAPPP